MSATTKRIEEIMTSSEAVEYLASRGYEISDQYFFRLVNSGRIRAAIKAHKLGRYMLEDVKAYADERDEIERLKRECWTTNEVAKKLGYSPFGAQQALLKLGVKPIKTRSGRLFYRPKEILAAIERSRSSLIAAEGQPRGPGRPPGPTKKRK